MMRPYLPEILNKVKWFTAGTRGYLTFRTLTSITDECYRESTIKYDGSYPANEHAEFIYETCVQDIEWHIMLMTNPGLDKDKMANVEVVWVLSEKHRDNSKMNLHFYAVCNGSQQIPFTISITRFITKEEYDSIKNPGQCNYRDFVQNRIINY